MEEAKENTFPFGTHWKSPRSSLTGSFGWVCINYIALPKLLSLSYILMSTFCFSFVHSGLVWPVSAQILILYWHITAHNILRKRVSWYIMLTFEQQNLFFRLLSGVAALPRVIKAHGRLESHNYVWIDCSLSCPCLEPESMQWHWLRLCSPRCCDQRVPACTPGRAGARWRKVWHYVSQGWCTGWSVLDGKTKALLGAKDIHMKCWIGWWKIFFVAQEMLVIFLQNSN